MLRERDRIDEHADAVGNLVEEARQFAHPLKTVEELDPLIKRLGDAPYTDMTRAGLFNIRQLARAEHHNDGVLLVEFGSYYGTVNAGNA